jgi:hypothetical protein
MLTIRMFGCRVSYMSTFSDTRHPLDLGDLIEVCRFLRTLREERATRGLEHALDFLFEWVHERIGERRAGIVGVLARTVSCHIDNIIPAIGVLSSSYPCRTSEALHAEWRSLRKRLERVLRDSGRDPDRCLPVME